MTHHETGNNTEPVTLFLCGDVMAGRGIDQILPHPSSSKIYESYMTNAAVLHHIDARMSKTECKLLCFH
jgi:poly-gamma-glutamate capsule biosynthesis protein CapA/YwtB (metallophosphatase superfamily)